MRAALAWLGLTMVLAVQPPAEAPQLARLREAAAEYERITNSLTWTPLTLPARVIRPGDELPEAGILHVRLIALGDLPPQTKPPEVLRLTDTLSEGLRRFQSRHGLTVDGVLGPATAAALAVTPRQRLAQIRDSIARLSTMDLADERSTVLVNVPMFHLWAWNGAPWTQPAAVEMRVITGAPSTPTPTFEATFDSITFRPFWNVPTSIAVKELRPRIRRDPAYLTRHHYELVAAQGQVVPPTGDALARLGTGDLRIRQRPGDDNSLGLIRFDARNPHGVFLHDTPSRALFARPRRAFSHGCIRLERPAALAQWALADPAWDAAAIELATRAEDNRQVPIGRAIRLLVVSVPALITDDGALWFADATARPSPVQEIGC